MENLDHLYDLAETLSTVIQQYIEKHPDIPVDEVAAVVSYVQGTMFRLASDVPASKLH